MIVVCSLLTPCAQPWQLYVAYWHLLLPPAGGSKAGCPGCLPQRRDEPAAAAERGTPARRWGVCVPVWPRQQGRCGQGSHQRRLHPGGAAQGETLRQGHVWVHQGAGDRHGQQGTSISGITLLPSSTSNSSDDLVLKRFLPLFTPKPLNLVLQSVFVRCW